MSIPVIAIFDIGKTNKKFFLFDEDYKIVFEKNKTFEEIKDEDGDDCEDIQQLTEFIFQSFNEAFSKKEFDIKAINFSAYGASLVYVDENGRVLAPLYNYLKKYPAMLSKKFYEEYGGEEKLSLETASPVLGSLNSGMQLYRTKYEKPEIFGQIKYVLHLPQYLSYRISKLPVSDITSIGCHTNLWNFQERKYHEWISRENFESKLAPIVSSSTTNLIQHKEKKIAVGVGLHDSSAALVPYLKYFEDPFVLISTGTWSISLNPFNQIPLSSDELKRDCLCYLTHEGKSVKASRLFAGHEHDDYLKKSAKQFQKPYNFFEKIKFNPLIISKLFSGEQNSSSGNYEDAYHRFMFGLVKKQYESTKLVLQGTPVAKIFVDGGFSKNGVYMNLLAMYFKETEIFAANIPQASAIGAAMAIHESWNSKPLPENVIEAVRIKN